MSTPTIITYCTSSPYKIEELAIIEAECSFTDGTRISDVFKIEPVSLRIVEDLEIDLHKMVEAEVSKAYATIKVPCIVEHAGLLFIDDGDGSFPGGLTKPMWDSLGEDFPLRTGSAGRSAVARAVVAYCDGRSIKTFQGETPGTIAPEVRGGRKFYWDSVFIPDAADGSAGTMTYSEIVDDPTLGLDYKVRQLSQSTKALLAFLEYRRSNGPELWEE
jgi:XTP/dITP diphosphohydrolase